MFNSSATNRNKSAELLQAHPGAQPDSEEAKRPPLPGTLYAPYSEKPALSEPPYTPYAEKPAEHEPPYEPYKGIQSPAKIAELTGQFCSVRDLTLVEYYEQNNPPVDAVPD